MCTVRVLDIRGQTTGTHWCGSGILYVYLALFECKYNFWNSVRCCDFHTERLCQACGKAFVAAE